MRVVLVLIALLVIALESVSYLGFIAKHFLLPAYLFYPLILLTPRLRSRLLVAITILASITYLILSILESFTYQNYVYSHLHINLVGFSILTVALIMICCLVYGRSLLVAGLTFFALSNVAGIFPQLVRALTPILQDPLATYDTKMTRAYPGFYPAMQMVASLTPSNAIIILPPQANPWVTEGNPFLVERFLYPRRLTQLTVGASLPQGKVYFLIAKGSWPLDGSSTYGWPKVQIAASRIWRFDVSTHKTTEFSRDYDPTTDTWDWGLIEVRL